MMKTRNPDYLYAGQIVYVTARHVLPSCNPTTGLRCVVIQAHGDHGLLENKRQGFRKADFTVEYVCPCV
ncbi:MAG: hypothetical protein KGL39_10655 [Patescibacteria group bacterium]|nr:hypothetical protein [Patescibacteria group bacterium]